MHLIFFFLCGYQNEWLPFVEAMEINKIQGEVCDCLAVLSVEMNFLREQVAKLFLLSRLLSNVTY